jgi:adenylylsulfate kinase-like enzyme
MARLVVLVGPIASGKSTLATALGVRLRRAGQEVEVLDFDTAVQNAGGFGVMNTEQFQRVASDYAKRVVRHLVAGADVIAHHSSRRARST